MNPSSSDPGHREKILRLLHADRAKSAARLDLLEGRLSCFFRWERATDPLACAAAVMRDLVERLDTGSEVLDPEGCALELAREHLDRVPARRADPPARVDATGTESVFGWLTSLPPADRDLLVRCFPFDLEKREAARSGSDIGRRSRLLARAIDLRERCSGFVRQNRD